MRHSLNVCGVPFLPFSVSIYLSLCCVHQDILELNLLLFDLSVCLKEIRILHSFALSQKFAA